MVVHRPRRGLRWSLLLLGWAVLGCEEDFPLGSWELSSQGGAGGMPTDMMPPPTPLADPLVCGEVGTPGPFNPGGTAIGTTNLNTDWTWPTPLDSMEWDLVIEDDPPVDGYYFAHQFAFEGGQPGFFGLQAHGGYQADPPAPGSTPAPGQKPPVTEFVKMALFWIGGLPIDAELGDIKYPDARAALQAEGGGQWMTIHAKYDWVACHTYNLRVAKDHTDDTGVWYGAWIRDKDTDVVTWLGSILVSSDYGRISRFSTMYTTRIDNANLPESAVTTCADPEPESVIFGTPTGNDGQVLPLPPQNNFATPGRCPTSRFTELSNGIRHEIGVPRTLP